MSKLLSYYKSLEKAVEVPSEKLMILSSMKDKRDSFKEDERVFLDLLQIQALVYLPLLELYQCYFKHHIRQQTLDEVSLDLRFDRGYHYRPVEIYHILRQYDIEIYSYVISKISNSVYIYDQLCEAIEDENEGAFVSTLKTNQCFISDPVNRICYYLSRADIEKIENECDELINEDKVVGIYDASIVFSGHLQKLEDKFGSDPLLTKISELAALPSMGNNPVEELLLKKQNLLVASKMIYKELYHLDEFNRPRENRILKKVTTRPEVSNIFKEWEAEYENDVVAVGDIELSDTTQITKLSKGNRIFCFDEVEDNHWLSKRNWKNAPQLNDKNNAYEETIFGPGITPEQIEAVFCVLVDYRCIDNTQSNLDLLATRLSRKAIVAEDKLAPITWNGTHKNLCYFIKKIANISEDNGGSPGKFFTRSKSYFVYPNGEPFKSEGASQYAMSPTVEFEKKLKQAIENSLQ